MSLIRSGIDELAAEELAWVGDERLENDLTELRRDLDALEAQWVRRLSEFDRRRVFERLGYRSAGAWLVHRCRLAWGAARLRVRVARGLRSMPRTEAAYQAAEIDLTRAGQLVRARADHPEVFDRDEAVLVEAATNLGVKQLQTALDYWRQGADSVSALERHNHLYRRRSLHISKTLDGAIRLGGDLDPEGGDVVMTAINAHTDAFNRAPDDDRTPAQRRADALVDICRDYLNHGNAPMTGGERPHLSLIVELETLEGRAHRRCELESGVIHPETARRIACDAGLSRIITDGASQPLDVGRRTRTIPPAIRRALVIRDGGCSTEGCDVPPRWCDVHHKTHWADGGETRLDDLELQCRFHHIKSHEGLPPPDG